ncbi:MAG: hypothetical protein VYA30_05455 [Myxococcota bacterium]|nr:hypothetical protein [Myxococcota bacterium]
MSIAPENKLPSGFWRAILLIACLSTHGCGECEEDYDCPGTLICNVASKRCEALVCRSHKDCEVGYSCTENRCQQSSEAPQTENAEELELQRR